jgi:hypothetical protein
MLDADHSRNCIVILCRIEAAPLDLSTASYCLAHPAFYRQVCFGLSYVLHHYQGHWPFGRGTLSRSETEQILAPVMSHVSETLVLPGIHILDECVQNPEAWITRNLSEHDPLKLQDIA